MKNKLISYKFDSSDKIFNWSEDPCVFFGFDDEDKSLFESDDSFSKLAKMNDCLTRVQQFKSIVKMMKAQDCLEKQYQFEYGLRPSFDRRDLSLKLQEEGKITLNKDGSYSLEGEIRRVHLLEQIQSNLHAETKDNYFDIVKVDLDRTEFLEILRNSLSGLNYIQSKDVVALPDICMLSISINKLHEIKEIYGYEIANDALSCLADRLKLYLRSEDIIGNLQTNMMTAIVPGADLAIIHEIGHRLLQVLRPEAIQTRIGPLITSLSIGGIKLGEDSFDVNETIFYLEQAQNIAAQQGGNAIYVYKKHYQQQSLQSQNIALATHIISSLNNDKFFLQTQPIVDAQTQEVIFEEGYVRISTDDGKILYPGSFLKTATQLGIGRLIDIRCLELALDYLSDNPDKMMSINITSQTILDQDWDNRLSAISISHQNILSRLIIEIELSEEKLQIHNVAAFIDRMHNFGARVALHNFGANSIGFNVLKQLRLDMVKLDGSYGSGLAKNRLNQSFVKCLTELAHELDMDVVIEWIGGAEDAACASECNVDFLQGNYFGASADIEKTQAEQPPQRRYNHLKLVK